MKNAWKKVLSFCLVFALLLPFAALPASAATAAPLVYVYGEQSIFMYKEDGSVTYPKDDPDGIASAAVSELAPLFAKSMLTGDYTEWSERALEMLRPIYADIKPAPDGTLPAGTYTDYIWDHEHIKCASGPLGLFYPYVWDFRTSPMDAADDLKLYIDKVKAATGSDTVALASRCGGSEAMAAYLVKYGYADVEKAIFFCNNLHGFTRGDLFLSGNVTINAPALERYIQFKGSLAGMGISDEIYNFLMSLVISMNKTGSMQDIADTVMQVYPKIKDSFIAPFIREFYGIGGGYIGSIDAHYEDYRDYIFPTEALKTEYAAILEKADAYHYEVQNHIDDLIKEMDQNGVPVYFLVNYGEQLMPLGEQASYVGDDDATVTEQSYGATCAKMEETLPASYIRAQEKAGLGKYISPDKQIDASTAMFPDRTFFIKNLRHTYYCYAADYLVQIVANTQDITIDTLSELPQFLTTDENKSTVTPAQAHNDADIDWDAFDAETETEGASGFFVNVLSFFAQIFATFRSLFTLIKTLFGIKAN